VFLVVDNMFGSDGRFHTRVEGRDFTPTEQRIIQGMLNVVFEEYAKAWKPVYEVDFEYVRSEMNTQFANIATPSEIVVSFTFTIELSGNSAEMHLCLPYSMIEPIRDVLYSTMHSEQAGSDQRWTAMLRRQLVGAEVELVVPLGRTQITVGEVARLKTGDVIPIEIDELVKVNVDGIPLMECRYGINNGQYALKVEQFLALEDATD
jgi:flagellar motor switch protein FliM